MKTSTLVLNHLLPRESVELGRLVTNIHDPVQEYCQPDPLPLPVDAISTQFLENFATILQNSKRSGLSAFLTQTLSGRWSVSKGVTTDIAAAAFVTRQLNNCEEVLHSVCKISSVRTWLERAARRKRSVYIICGLKILVDARIRQGFVQSSELDASIQVPGSVITAAAGIPIPLDNTLDVGTGTTLHRKSREQGEYVATGEHIFAVQYRKIKIGRFSSRDVDPACLHEGSKWKIYLSTRGGPANLEEDGMEVDVGEPVDASDIKRPCERFDVGEEEILFCPLPSR